MNANRDLAAEQPSGTVSLPPNQLTHSLADAKFDRHHEKRGSMVEIINEGFDRMCLHIEQFGQDIRSEIRALNEALLEDKIRRSEKRAS